jgi:hypothetical protein
MIALSAAAILAVAGWCVWQWFPLEVLMLSWHVRHGFSYAYEDVRLQVPLWSYVRCRGELCSIPILPEGAPRGRFSLDGWACPLPRGGFISLRPQRSEQTLAYGRERDATRRGERLRLGTRNVIMAGVALTCDEYQIKGLYPREVCCYRSSPGPVPSYVGTPAALPQFYAELESARMASR